MFGSKMSLRVVDCAGRYINRSQGFLSRPERVTVKTADVVAALALALDYELVVERTIADDSTYSTIAERIRVRRMAGGGA